MLEHVVLSSYRNLLKNGNTTLRVILTQYIRDEESLRILRKRRGIGSLRKFHTGLTACLASDNDRTVALLLLSAQGASGKKLCVRTLHTRPKRLDARDATWQGSLTPDDACQRTCGTRQEPPVHMRTRRRWAAHWPSGRIMPGQMSSGRCTPRHLFSGRRVSGHLPSGRSACTTDAECQGKCPPDDACHGICLPDEECQCIFPS